MVPLVNHASAALAYLFVRLKWPVPKVRWRAAKEIRNLLNAPATRPSAIEMLLNCIEEALVESEVCTLLTIIFLSSPDARPARATVIARVKCPSLLAEMLLIRIYGESKEQCAWRDAHSGAAPSGFEGGRYFDDHSTAHVPPIMGSNLKRLERRHGLPFRKQWAFEWKALCSKLGTRRTGYPHYFGDASEVQAGIVGQYWQRMREVYQSAYLRTLAHAVSVWGMPQQLAESYCLDVVDGIGGLFEMDAKERPGWLSDYPERFCAPNAEFASIARKLFVGARQGSMVVASLDTPIAASVQKYARLRMSLHLVLDGYEFQPGSLSDRRTLVLPVDDAFELKGLLPIEPKEELNSFMRQDAIDLCSLLFPHPFGSWHGDYYSLGLAIPSPSILGEMQISCAAEGIELTSADGAVVSTTTVWNDGWNPSYPKGGATRCGTVTMVNAEALDLSSRRLGRRLALFVKLQSWRREKEYDDYEMFEQEALLRL